MKAKRGGAGVRRKRDKGQKDKTKMQQTRDRDAENRRVERALAVCERNEERLWALCPAVKQDGGQQRTRCQTTESAEQQGENRMRL